MSLDIHVMPLCRFLCGDYVSVTEKLFGHLAPVRRIGSPKRRLSTEDARNYVQALQLQVFEAVGVDISWPDDGDTVFSDQYTFRSWHVLRAFAAHQEYPARALLGLRERRVWEEDRPEDHPGIKRIWDGAKSNFRHLIVHDDLQGLYVPVRFEHPVSTDRERTDVIGSSVVLLEELARLKDILHMNQDWGDRVKGQNLVPDKDPLFEVKNSWAFMYYCAKLSISSRLPIIFDG